MPLRSVIPRRRTQLGDPSVDITRVEQAIGRARPLGAAWQDRGAAAVEAALLVPIIILVVFGSLDFGRALWWKIQVTNAAREGASYARLFPCDAAGISARVDAELGQPPNLPIVISPTPSSSCTATGYQKVTVTVAEQVPFLTPGLTLVAGQSGVTVSGDQSVSVLAETP